METLTDGVLKKVKKMTYKKEMEILEAFGCKEIEYTNLVNNYFISFTYNDKRFTAEHILNVYGAEVDYWELKDKSFNTLIDALNYIK